MKAAAGYALSTGTLPPGLHRIIMRSCNCAVDDFQKVRASYIIGGLKVLLESDANAVSTQLTDVTRNELLATLPKLLLNLSEVVKVDTDSGDNLEIWIATWKHIVRTSLKTDFSIVVAADFIQHMSSSASASKAGQAAQTVSVKTEDVVGEEDAAPVDRSITLDALYKFAVAIPNAAAAAAASQVVSADRSGSADAPPPPAGPAGVALVTLDSVNMFYIRRQVEMHILQTAMRDSQGAVHWGLTEFHRVVGLG